MAVASEPDKKNLLILGMHHSGTSMIAGMLAQCGWYVGDDAELLPSAQDNPRGFWERRDVVELNDALLHGAGGSWYQPLPESAQLASAACDAVVAGLGEQPWLLKDPRLLLTWPAWQEALAGTLTVFVYRSPLAVANSLRARHGFPLEYGLALWQYYNLRALAILPQRDHVPVSYDDFAANPTSGWEQLVEGLAQFGVALPEQVPVGFFEPTLNHATEPGVDAARLTSAQSALHEYIAALAVADEPGPAPQADPAMASCLHENAAAFAELTDLIALRSAMETLTLERDKARSDHKKQEQHLNVLQETLLERNSEVDRLDDLQKAQHKKLLKFEKHMQQLKAQAQAQIDELFNRLNLTYLKLLEYSRSWPGKMAGSLVWLYKCLRWRLNSHTALDDVLEDAAEHAIVREPGPGSESPPTPPGRLRLLLAVLRYVLANPVASLRSFSGYRLRRWLAVFIGGHRDDLTLWVRQRFPGAEESGFKAVKPKLDASLDSLCLNFAPTENPLVSIILPVYNQYRMTLYCLQSLLQHSGDVEYEVIVADDASSDLTASISERVSGIRVRRAPDNRGFVLNCNAGAQLARGRYLLFLNNDTAFTEAWLSALVAVLEQDDNAGVAGPMLLFDNGRLQEAGGIVWRDASGWNYGRADDPGLPAYNYRRCTDYVSGACLMIRASLWHQLGGFDERYAPAYYEDTDLCFATRAAGFEVVYQPHSRVYHFEGVSHGTDPGTGIKKHQAINADKFREKWSTVLAAEHFPNAGQVFLARDRSRSRRTVLVIDHYVPSYDKDAGSRSSWMYLQLLVDMGYNVKFIGANFFPHQPYTRELQALGVEVLVGEDMARKLPAWLKAHAGHIDTVYIHRPHVAEQFLEQLRAMSPRPRLIFFGHDLHFLRVERECRVTGTAELEARAQEWRRRELAVFQQVDKVYYPSQVEVDVLKEAAPDCDARAIPLYVMEDSVEPDYNREQRADILFVGGFNHPPNVDGLCWFVDAVMPLVWQQCPELTLHVVGSNAPLVVQSLDGPQVKVHGYLSDRELSRLYDSVRMVAVPLRFGAGVNGKILEALQHGVPVVTTDIGAEGLPEPETVLTVAATVQDFAGALLQLESGEAALLGKRDNYRRYLNQWFSRSRAEQILREDFGAPHIERRFS